MQVRVNEGAVNERHSMNRLATAVAVAAIVLGPTAVADAQRPLQQVLDLNRQAMDAYTNLNLEESQRLLNEALRVARQGGVRGAPLARTYVNLGVVAISGFGETAQGMTYFRQALQADANVQLDPLTSTPDITIAFQAARSQGGVSDPGPGPGPGPDPEPRGPGTIPHTPVPEQLSQTAVPVFVEVPSDAPVGAIYVYYKGLGMREFQRAQMRRLTGGYGFEIPCTDVFEPSVEYYIVAFDDEDNPMGFAGTQESPIRIPVVSSRSHPPASLPGQPPPQQCGANECPPGMAGCSSGGTAGLGDTCRETSDCAGSLVCEDEFCVTGQHPDDDDDDDDASSTDAPRFFIDIGATVGLGYAQSGMQADTGDDGSAPPENSPWVRGGTEDCDLDPAFFCVRIATPGFVPTFAIRAALGYWVHPRVAIGLQIRFQPSAGVGDLANMLIGLRLYAHATEPTAEGFIATPFIGSSYGQIQLQPPQNGGAEPFIISGLNSVQFGSTLGYRFMRNVAIIATPEFHVMFPTFLFDIDLTVGLQASF